MSFLEKDSRESFSFQINPVENHKPLANSVLKSLLNQTTQDRRTPWDPRKQILLHQSTLGSCLDTQEAQPCYKKVNKIIKKYLSLNDKHTEYLTDARKQILK